MWAGSHFVVCIFSPVMPRQYAIPVRRMSAGASSGSTPRRRPRPLHGLRGDDAERRFWVPGLVSSFALAVKASFPILDFASGRRTVVLFGITTALAGEASTHTLLRRRMR